MEIKYREINKTLELEEKQYVIWITKCNKLMADAKVEIDEIGVVTREKKRF